MTTTTKKRNKLYVLVVIALVLFIAVGYAILQSNLRINGTTKISKSSWDVHFENVTSSNRGVTASSPATIDSSKTGVNFAVNLKHLGEFYEFYVDVVNNGNFDAKLESINTTNLTEEQKKYLDLEVTYSDGGAINIGDVLRSLKKDTIKVMVQYKPDPVALPESTSTLNFNVQLSFVQDDGNGRVRSGNVLYNVLKDNSVMDNIASTYVSSSTGINLGEISSDTNGKGVYTLSKTANNANPVYYYRGAVDNNNVIFGGYCWKMIRTTDTAGVKMIYNGSPNNGICNNMGEAAIIGTSAFNENMNDAKYVGYTYDDGTGKQVDSTIKAKVDEWYSSNLNEYTSFLEDSPFYNERDYVIGNGIPIVFSPRLRIWGNEGKEYADNIEETSIRLGAANLEDIYTVSVENGNGLLKHPIGLLTSDEAVLAGGRGWISDENKGENDSYYLYSENKYRMLSSYFFNGNARMIVINYDGSIYSDNVSSNNVAVRPVISLKAGTTYTSGNGTVNSPYKVNDVINYSGTNLYNRIKSQAVKDNEASTYVTGTNKDGQPGIHFGQISSDTNGKGVYELTQTKEDGETIYYYRGAVDNNNVEFGGFCWKIVRTSSTKGVKLIYNGLKQADGCTATDEDATIGKMTFNSKNLKLKYAGYTYPTDEDDTEFTTNKAGEIVEVPIGTFTTDIDKGIYEGKHVDSTIKKAVDTWFASNLASYEKYLEDTPFYNERDNVAGDGFPIAFAPRLRIWGTTKTVSSVDTSTETIKLGATNIQDKYTVSSSKGNGFLKYPIGLLTSDEAILGGFKGESNAGASVVVIYNSFPITKEYI